MIKLGTVNIEDINIGSDHIAKVYKGSDVVWEAEYYGVKGITTSSEDFTIGGGSRGTPTHTAKIVGDNGDGTYNFECNEKFSNVKSLLDNNTNIVKISLLSVPKQITDFTDIFSRCSNLTEITQIIFRTPALVVSGFIHGCRKLTTFPAMGNIVTAHTTNAHNFFSYCTSLNIDVSGWDTSGITTAYNMDCFGGLGDYASEISTITWGAGFFNTMANISVSLFRMKDYASCKSMLESILANSKSIPYGESGSYWQSQQDFDDWNGTQTISLHNNIKAVINANSDLVALMNEVIGCGWVIQ